MVNPKSPERTSREISDGIEKLSLSEKEVALVPVEDELERFRSEWRNEVKSKKQPQPGPTTARNALSPERSKGSQGGPSTRNVPNSNGIKGKDKVENGSTISPPRATRPLAGTQLSPAQGSRLTLIPSRSSAHSATTTKSTSPLIEKQNLAVVEVDSEDEERPNGSTRWPDKLKTFGRLFSGRHSGGAPGDAVTVYSRAVEAEQGGQLNDALKLYRQAFKMDDNVDRAYAIRRNKVKEAPSTPSSTDLVSATPPLLEPFSFQRTIQTHPDYEKTHIHPHPNPHSHSIHPVPVRTSPLTLLMQQTPTHPSLALFLPADENLPVPISLLPREIIEQILSHLDIPAIESFGSTSWRARYLTATSEQWRVRAERIYTKEAINPSRVPIQDLGRRYGEEWRTLMVEEERVRFDGCYIAVCHYVRPGAGDEWVAVTHMITYHRFLRFYPDGTVISFLTTDHPSEVVPLLKPSLRAKGLHIGSYTLLPLSDLPVQSDAVTAHPIKRHHSRILISDLLEPGSLTPKYEFEMDLSLRETSRGRWNKLDITDYRSINLATGEVLGLVLKHQKPFYFSNSVLSSYVLTGGLSWYTTITKFVRRSV